MWAAVPVKEFAGAKQRLSALLTLATAPALAAAMLEDVLEALAGAQVAGIMVETLDPAATRLAAPLWRASDDGGARDGHTRRGCGDGAHPRGGGRGDAGLPGDIPRVTPARSPR